MSNYRDLFELQNGSDIRGIALDTAKKKANLDGDAVSRITQAFVIWLKEKTGKDKPSIGVGHDSRITADEFKGRVTGAAKASVCCVSDCGLASTPAMFMGTVFPETDFDGSIVLTASHLPREYNGMKFFTKNGGLEKEDIRRILELTGNIAPISGSENAEGSELMNLYSVYLREKIISASVRGDEPLKGLHIVVDAGNGTGGFFVKNVLEPLGADCYGSQFLNPDGNFPNHIPNPENSAAMDSLRKAVIESKADLGIIFDTDADRMSAVLSDGSEVNRDAIIAMMAAIIAPDYPGGTIVTDSVTSDRLTVFLENLGLKHRRFKRGYRNVINEAIRLNEEGVISPLAIETSGHGAMKENYFLDDGAYMAVKLVSAAAHMRCENKKVDSLIEALPPAAEETERRIHISDNNPKGYGAEVLEKFRERALEKGIALAETCEGVRLTIEGKGWVLLRQSLHEPLLPLNLEANSKGGCAEMLNLVRELLDGFDKLDLSVL